MREAADRAGGAMPSVSRVLSGHTDVCPRTREVALTAVRDLGYQPNVLAQGLRGGETFSIFVTVSDIASPGVPCARVDGVAVWLGDVRVGPWWALVGVVRAVLGAVGRVASRLRAGGFDVPAGRGGFRGGHARAVRDGLCGYWEARVAACGRGRVLGAFPSEAGVAA